MPTDSGAGDDRGADVVALDAPGPDAGPLDGGSEGSTDAAAPPPLACDKVPADTVFCSTFDGTSTIDEGWSSPFTFNGGAVAPNTTTIYSGTRALETTLPQVGSLTYANLFFNYVDTNSRPHYLLSFAFRVVTPGAVRIARFEYTATTAAKAHVDVVLGPGTDVGLVEAAALNDGGVAQASHKLGSFVPGTWHHVTLDFKLSSPASTQATFDGASQQLGSVLPLPATNASKTRDVFVGTYAPAGTTGPVDVLFDDVLYRIP